MGSNSFFLTNFAAAASKFTPFLGHCHSQEQVRGLHLLGSLSECPNSSSKPELGKKIWLIGYTCAFSGQLSRGYFNV